MATEKLELLILKTLAATSLHGYGIGQRIEQRSGGVFRVALGSLYPALQRLEKDPPTTTAARGITASPRRGGAAWPRR